LRASSPSLLSLPFLPFCCCCLALSVGAQLVAEVDALGAHLVHLGQDAADLEKR
jgi:hypothetical protein